MSSRRKSTSIRTSARPCSRCTASSSTSWTITRSSAFLGTRIVSVLKRAYFELAARFHPDRYFRKKLGSFKQRMEVIFGRITLAQETLGKEDRRAEYDAYLAERQRSRGIEELLADAMASRWLALRESVERAANEVPAGAAPAPLPPAADGPGPAPAKTGTSSGSRPVDPAIRREALARKLLGGQLPLPSASASRPSIGGTIQAATARVTPGPHAAGGHGRRCGRRLPMTSGGGAAPGFPGRGNTSRTPETAFAAGASVGGQLCVASAANNFRGGGLAAARRRRGLSPCGRGPGASGRRAGGDLPQASRLRREERKVAAEAARSWARVVGIGQAGRCAGERTGSQRAAQGGRGPARGLPARQGRARSEPKSAAFSRDPGQRLPCRPTWASTRGASWRPPAQLAPHSDDTIQAMLKRVASIRAHWRIGVTGYRRETRPGWRR